jgi:hypothetical protein
MHKDGFSKAFFGVLLLAALQGVFFRHFQGVQDASR